MRGSQQKTTGIGVRPNAGPETEAGFTLIELLAVAAIIGVLAALLIPAVSSGTEKARNAQCVNNLRTIAASLHLYLGDHEAVFPDLFWSRQYEQCLLLFPYLNDPATYACPTAQRNETSGRNWPDIYCTTINDVQFCTDYKVNDSDLLGSASISAVPRLFELVFACDLDWSPSGRHRGKENFAFYDGSVRALSRQESQGPDSAGKQPWFNWGMP